MAIGRRLQFVIYGPLHKLFECLTPSQLAFPRVVDPRMRAGTMLHCLLRPSLTSHPLSLSLYFVCQKGVSLAHTQSNQVPPLEEGNMKEFVDIFKNHHKWLAL